MLFFDKEVKEAGGLALYLTSLRPVVIMGRGHSGTRVLTYACTHLGLSLGATGLGTGDANDRKFTEKIKRITLDNLGITSVEKISDKDLTQFQAAEYGYYKRLGAIGKGWGPIRRSLQHPA